MQAAKDKAHTKENAVQSRKDHILQWGLDSNYIYSLALGAKLNTTGWTGGIYYTKQKSAGKKAFRELQFSEIRHEKQVKQQRSGDTYRDLGKFRSYFVGKVNYVYTLQLGYGREQLLFPALLDGNLSVSFRYSIGPAIAFLKPVYLNLIYTDYNPDPVSHIQSEKYSSDNAEQFLNPDKILGSDKWSKGLNDMEYIPGAFVEAAFVLEPDRPKAFVKSVIIGGQFALYAQKLSIMADRKAFPYQACFFVGVDIGKRWQ